MFTHNQWTKKEIKSFHPQKIKGCYTTKLLHWLFSSILIVFIMSAGLFGCAQAEEDELQQPQQPKQSKQHITVAAAADLYYAFAEIADVFEAETGIEVTFSFGATGVLTQQVAQGAPFDVFAAAHESFIDRLIEAEHIAADTKQLYALGELVVITRKGTDVQLEQGDYIGDPFSHLFNDSIRHIAIANPEHAPYGMAAKQALQSAGVWNELQNKIVFGDNVRQALQLVETGNADAGIVSLALMMQEEDEEKPYTMIEVDEQMHEPIVQALGIPVQTANKELAQQFSDFVMSETGQNILQRYGFNRVEE